MYAIQSLHRLPECSWWESCEGWIGCNRIWFDIAGAPRRCACRILPHRLPRIFVRRIHYDPWRCAAGIPIHGFPRAAHSSHPAARVCMDTEWYRGDLQRLGSAHIVQVYVYFINCVLILNICIAGSLLQYFSLSYPSAPYIQPSGHFAPCTRATPNTKQREPTPSGTDACPTATLL